ncbi:FliH/SctL family protein [Desulfothermobacter acidiphilus]|uniref:FliH/SctL family protein n=1 Tax=Desulfothermobacter acidiphilus TaxID=1938353 RepID=UPI003F8CBA81
MPWSYNSRVLQRWESGRISLRSLPLKELSPPSPVKEPEEPESAPSEEELLAALRAEVEAQVARAREEAGRIQKEAEARLAAARLEAEELVQRARQAVAAAEEERRRLLEQLEPELLELAVAMARRLVAAELQLHPEAVLNLVREALSLVRDRSYFLILLHPEDLELCQAHRQELESLLPEGAALHLLPDPRLNRGECQVETDQGVVDSTFKARWETLMESLKGV